jgi:hypothetical protein
MMFAAEGCLLKLLVDGEKTELAKLDTYTLLNHCWSPEVHRICFRQASSHEIKITLPCNPG